MKKIIFISFILTFLFSCENEPLDATLSNQITDSNNSNTQGIFKVTFDGQTFQTSNVQCVIENNILILDALRTPNNDSFGFVIDNISVGTFNAKDHLVIYHPNPNSDYGYLALNINNPSENLGSITITNIDAVNKKISGTFNFKGYWSDDFVTNIPPKNFTSGSFTNISYETTTNSGDLFSANLNGVVFSQPTVAVATIDFAGQEFISIAGVRANDRINVNVKATAGTGSYTITGDNTDEVQAFYTITNPSYSQRSSIGLVTITEKTATRIKGTFNFSTPNSPIPYLITNGNFDVEY